MKTVQHLSLAAAATLSALASLSAQATDVVVYGRLNATFENVRVENGHSRTMVNDNASRIGFRGTEDLGGGMAVIYQIESRIRVDGNDAGTALATRDTWVGLRTQQVIDLETNINAVQDPFGGSWFMESLTDQVEARILAMVKDIESRGDPADLVSSGFFKQFFHGTMGRYHHQVQDGEVVKVGMNVHQMPAAEDTLLRDISEEKIPPLFDRIEQLKAWRAARDQAQLLAALGRVHDVVKSGENMMEAVLDATRVGATMGEIAGVLRQAWGTPYDPYGYLKSPLGGEQ